MGVLETGRFTPECAVIVQLPLAITKGENGTEAARPVCEWNVADFCMQEHLFDFRKT